MTSADRRLDQPVEIATLRNDAASGQISTDLQAYLDRLRLGPQFQRANDLTRDQASPWSEQPVQAVPDEIRTMWQDGHNPGDERGTLWQDGHDSLKELQTGWQEGDDPDPLDVYKPWLHQLDPALKTEAQTSTRATDAESHVRRDLVIGVLAAILAVRSLDWLAEAKRWEQKGRFDAQSFDRRMSQAFRKKLGPALAAPLTGVLLLGRGTVGDALSLAYSQDQARPVAARWAQSYAKKVAGDYAESSAEAVGAQVAEWVNKQLPAASMALRARDMYGLDPRSMHAIASYTGTGKGPSRVALTERYLEHRADANASVWTMAAQNSGREMLFTELVEAGLLPKTTRKVWVTAHDERVCPICGPMDGVSVPLLSRFHVGGSHLMTAPVHPSCRCTLSVDTAPKQGWVFPQDFQMIHGWLRSATRSVYR